MTNYNAYREEKNISRAEMINALKTRYPKYTKAAQSFVDNPDKTGVCLLPDAEYILVDHYGFGSGLSIVDDGTYEPKHLAPPTKKKPRRKKPHSYTVRLSPELNYQVLELMGRLKVPTMQQLIEDALNYYAQQSIGEG